VEYVNFGSAGVKVSRLALGIGFRGEPDVASAQRIIEHAIDSGINLIDCANMYGTTDEQGHFVHSERILGRALRGKRDDVVITSKVCTTIGPGPNDRGLSRYHIMREVERSLTRLDTDHLDVYLVHGFDESTPVSETIRAFDDLVRSGKVLYVGCCNYTAWQVCRSLWVADMIHATPYMCVQNPYSLLNRALEREMFGLVREIGLGVMAFSPLAVGLLSGTYTPCQSPPPGSLWAERMGSGFDAAVQGTPGEVMTVLRELAAELGKTPTQLALAWILSHPEVTLAIVGCDATNEVTDIGGAVGWSLPDDVRDKLDRISAPQV
jgi:aryl-alcohol dehydrogenase-like predicted oxidoreductase